MTASQLVQNYYAAFNANDMQQFVGLLHEDVIHDINQGERQIGKAAFERFMQSMNRSYRETLADIVVMQNTDGTRAAAEFVVHGEYIATDEGLPAAHGQTYVLPAGAFFELRDGKIFRISNYYNMQDWLRQVGAA
jgi:steroid delta-isomerase-like uncharacterized protein